jgi:hypothetical protein
MCIKMAKIYRYIDMRDNFIKYVGIVYGENRTLEQRHKEHLKKDIWCDENFKVQYLDVPINSRSEAEALEAHFISLYQTGSWYNKSKSNGDKAVLYLNLMKEIGKIFITV